MMSGVTVLMLAQAAASAPGYGPPVPPKAASAPVAAKAAAAADPCPTREPKADQREIVVCAQRPQGYASTPMCCARANPTASASGPSRPSGSSTPAAEASAR